SCQRGREVCADRASAHEGRWGGRRSPCHGGERGSPIAMGRFASPIGTGSVNKTGAGDPGAIWSWRPRRLPGGRRMTLRQEVGLVGIFALATIAAFSGTPVEAAGGEVIITQESAMAGGVTPGDQPGFPVTITKAGRYRLASNLAPPRDADGIAIDADN